MSNSKCAPPWSLDGNRALLNSPRLRAECNAESPIDGFDALVVAGRPCAGRLWQMATPLGARAQNPLAELYVRERDLVARYSATRDFPFATQLDWRLVDEDAQACSITTIVSVQTDLLDTHPVIEISCELPVEEVLLLSTKHLSGKPKPVEVPLSFPQEAPSQVVLLRLDGTAATYVEAIDPSDFCGLEISRTESGSVRCTWRLFLHFLEKGVIRRSRLGSMLVPRENDVQHAVRCVRKLIASELPLTA